MNMLERIEANSAHRNRKVLRRFGLLAIATFMLAATIPGPAQAAPPVHSLDIVPADAAFYSAMLRNREQFEAIVNSKAFAKIMALPYVQMGLGLLQIQSADPNSPMGRFEAARRDPEVKKSLAFLADLFSDEIFVYGGPSFNQTVELLQRTYAAVQFNGPLMAGINGQARSARMEEIQGRAFVRALVAQVDRIKFPELVIGFKVKDQALAKEQIDQLELNLQMVLGMAPPVLQNRLKRATIAGSSYLTFTVDGAMVPWDPQVEEKIRSLAANPEDGDKLIEHLKKTTLVVSLGLRDDYLLLAIGPSTELLARLGEGTPLRAAPELAAVAKFADKRICSVGYLSKALSLHFNQTKASIDNMLQMVKTLLGSAQVPEQMREEIEKDAADLAADIKKLVPEIGPSSSISFLTEGGVEGYGYDWSEHPELDSSKPLDLLRHVGGNPVAVLVSRTKVSPEPYDLLVKWMGVGYGYLEKYGVPQMKPEERAEYEKIAAQVKPLVVRLDTTTRNLLIPALADGQTGLVIDAKLTSQQFLKALPPTRQALTMLEPAIIVSVSDAAKLKRAFEDYYAVADEFVEILKGIPKSGIPKDFKIPRPRVFNIRLGTAYGYRLPAEWGVDRQVIPNAGLSEKVGVLSISGQHTLRLLGEKEAMIAGFPLPADRPLAMYGGLDFVVFVDALKPWVELGLEKGTASLDRQVAEMARQHAKAVLEVLKVYRGSVSETYVEGKVTVTHSHDVFHDIEE